MRQRRARDNFGRLLNDWMAAVSSPDDHGIDHDHHEDDDHDHDDDDDDLG